MTDNEIIKVLECCKDIGGCFVCPLYTTDGNRCTETVIVAALDLIQRQQKRIERLKDNLDAVLSERADHSEAIEEFADRVVEQLKESSKIYCEEYDQRENNLYLLDAIDILKEMVGGSNDR